MTSLAPSEARWRAIARPIPREAPVTIEIRSWRGGVMVFSVLVLPEAIAKDQG